MTWEPRTRQEIADTAISDHAARAEDAERPVDVREGAPWWVVWQVLALLLESQEFQLDDLAKQLLPDTASTVFLDRHGAVEGLARAPATRAVLAVEITGPALAAVSWTTETFTAPNGEVYTPSTNADGTGTSTSFAGDGTATIYATARVAGTDGNQPNLTALTWSAAPSPADPTGTVLSTYTAATAVEADDAFARRILARRQERPASGNRADWQAWATAVTGVADAVVYPLLHPTYGTGTLGAVTVVALGPAQGDSPTNTRIISGALADAVAGYIEGAVDADGDAVTDGVQLRPVTISSGDYAVEPAGEAPEVVELVATFAEAYRPPFAYDASLVAVATSTTTLIKIAGDHTATYTTSRDILVNVGPTNYRGGYYKTRPTAVVYNAPDTELTVPTLPDTPVVGDVVAPAPPAWDDMRAALITLFDQLGPGDTSPACRWPGEETRLRSTLYRPALVAALVAQYDAAGALHCGVAGTLAVSVAAPTLDVTPAAKTIVTAATWLVHE